MSVLYKFKKRTGRRFSSVLNKSLLTFLKLKHGAPDYIFGFKGGLGDELLCTIPINHLAGLNKKIWFVTDHPELFQENNDVNFLLSPDLAKKVKVEVSYLNYIPPPLEGRDVVPDSHIVKLLCNKTGIRNNDIRLQSILNLSEQEIKQGAFAKDKILISTSGLSAKYPIVTKDWFIEYYQEVVCTLKDTYSFIQIGSATDPLLSGVSDMRGKLKIRESAAALHHASLYIGQIGFLMHLARAVNCVSVIIYGGREKPWQSGYACNSNLSIDIECSPCWSYTCPIDRECMKRITPPIVVDAVQQMLQSEKQITEEWLAV